jgi:hypothetical protein
MRGDIQIGSRFLIKTNIEMLKENMILKDSIWSGFAKEFKMFPR